MNTHTRQSKTREVKAGKKKEYKERNAHRGVNICIQSNIMTTLKMMETIPFIYYSKINSGTAERRNMEKWGMSSAVTCVFGEINSRKKLFSMRLSVKVANWTKKATGQTDADKCSVNTRKFSITFVIYSRTTGHEA